MLKLRKVAVTGGLSSGKTTVCRFLSELGAYVLSADEIVHQLLSSDQEIIRQVAELLGSEVCLEGKIDRAKVAAKVFNQPDLLKSLEKIIHPAVQNEINNHFQRITRKNEYSLFVVEIPLLFEAGFEKDYDMTVAVLSDVKRYQNGYELRMKRQMTPQEKAERADYTIENNGTLEELFQKVKHLYNQIT